MIGTQNWHTCSQSRGTVFTCITNPHANSHYEANAATKKEHALQTASTATRTLDLKVERDSTKVAILAAHPSCITSQYHPSCCLMLLPNHAFRNRPPQRQNLRSRQTTHSAGTGNLKGVECQTNWDAILRKRCAASPRNFYMSTARCKRITP